LPLKTPSINYFPKSKTSRYRSRIKLTTITYSTCNNGLNYSINSCFYTSYSYIYACYSTRGFVNINRRITNSTNRLPHIARTSALTTKVVITRNRRITNSTNRLPYITRTLALTTKVVITRNRYITNSTNCLP